MITDILITIAFYLVLLWLSVNLIGYLVRGLFVDPIFDELKEKKYGFLKGEIKKHQRAEKLINLIAVILNIVFFYALFHFWNIGVVAVAVIIMLGRLPDLLWEIKHDRKVQPHLLKKNALFYITSFNWIVAVPLLYYSLFYL